MSASQDLQLWERWNQSGRKSEDLEPLLDQLDPLIASHVNQYQGVNVPIEAIRSKAEDLTLKGIKTFNPAEKTQLSTHVGWQLRGLNRFVTMYQNPARIPQHQTHKIQQIQALRDRMMAEMGKPPSDYVLARKVGWSPRQVAALQKSLTRRVLDPELFRIRDPRTITPSRFQEIVSLLPSELAKNEKFVFQSTYGLGRPQLSVAQMARKLQTSPATISRIRKRVADTIDQYMQT